MSPPLWTHAAQPKKLRIKIPKNSAKIALYRLLPRPLSSSAPSEYFITITVTTSCWKNITIIIINVYNIILCSWQNVNKKGHHHRGIHSFMVANVVHCTSEEHSIISHICELKLCYRHLNDCTPSSFTIETHFSIIVELQTTNLCIKIQSRRIISVVNKKQTHTRVIMAY